MGRRTENLQLLCQECLAEEKKQWKKIFIIKCLAQKFFDFFLRLKTFCDINE